MLDRPKNRRVARVPAGIVGTIAAVAALLFLGGCAEEEVARDLPPLEADEVSGDVLWERIAVETDYTNYPFWPDHDGMMLGQAPHGAFHRIFITPGLREALPIDDNTVPDGSIIVKENYSSEETLTALTVMAKVRGFAPNTGDWFWARYTPEGAVQAEGMVGSCVSCHVGMQDNDYVIVYPLDRAPGE